MASACEGVALDNQFSSYPKQIQDALAEYHECAKTDGANADLHRIADFLTRIKSPPPEEWKKRFCDAQKAVQYSYSVITTSIEGVPIVLRQIDTSSDGDALVPHNLIVGGHIQPRFRIEAEARYGLLNFTPWEGECVPFLFEIASPDEYIERVKAESATDSLVYFIASLCRTEKFHFKYYKYEKRTWNEIPSAEFPKDRALENLWDWMGGGIRYTRNTPKFIQDGLQESELPFQRGKVIVKPSNWNFYTGLTARMWVHLESGIDFEDFDKQFSDDAARNHANEYADKYDIQVTE